MDAHKYPGVIKAYDTLTDAEKLERYKDSFQLYREIRKELTSTLEEDKKEIAALKKQAAQTQRLEQENEKLKAELRINPVVRIWRGLLRRLKRLLKKG